MKELTIEIIYDNCKENRDLQEGWGFSALIKTENHKILFDSGNDRNAFFSNTQKMGIDLLEISDVVFSHKHADHITGCEEILRKLRETSQIYLPKGFPSKKIPKNLQTHTVLNFKEIDEDIFSFVLKGGFFLYEQFLVLQTEKGLIVITGCAHPGIINIIETAQNKLKKPIYMVLGGFHLFRKNRYFVQEILNKFKDLQVKKVAPCHCCGKHAIEHFQKIYEQDFLKIGTGSILKVI